MNGTMIMALISILAGLSAAGFVWFLGGLLERINLDLVEWRAARRAAAEAAQEEAAKDEAEEATG